MLYNTKNRINYAILLLMVILSVSCSSNENNTINNIEGTWNAYWYNDVVTEDYFIVDENTSSGSIVGRWYDAQDNVFYNATGTISNNNININVEYPFSWNLSATLNDVNNSISGEVIISGTNSVLDATHPIRFVYVN